MGDCARHATRPTQRQGRQSQRRAAGEALVKRCGIVLALALALAFTPSAHAVEQITDNGAWSWFQDERAVVDPARGKLLVGSSANRAGPGGLARDGDIDVTSFDLASRRGSTFTLHDHLVSGGWQAGDDHNAPALLVRPDGAYLAVYAGHRNDDYSYYRIYEGGRWGPEHRFDWNTMPGRTDFPTTYSNLFYLSAEDRVYNIARSDDRSPNIMVSDDLGETWRYGGQLTQADERVGYVDGYFKCASDGVDRIDFIATEHHPHDFNTSVYHGFVKGGKSHATRGGVVDTSIADKAAPDVRQFTQVFKAGTRVRGVPMTRAWTIDLETYAGGTITALFEARAADSVEDHRYFYARYDGDGWSWDYLGKAGPRLYPGEQDYTGLGALAPDDPNTVYISTPVDPRNGEQLGVREIFEGQRVNGRWRWRAVTKNSTHDNLRPIVPAWNGVDRAVLWMRGTYTVAQGYDLQVVGTFLKVGGPGRDRLVGTVHGDTIRGGAGRDFIKGRAGADNLESGPGRDRVLCGAGNDGVRADRRDRLRGCERVR
jgi:RTX calcium-binding nonapeptide repeat (4 copies)